MTKSEILKTIASIEEAQLEMIHHRGEPLSEELFREIYTLLDGFLDQLIIEASNKGASSSTIATIVTNATIRNVEKL